MKAMPRAIVSIGSPFGENGTVIEVHEGIRINGQSGFTRMIKTEKTSLKCLETYLISNQFNIRVAQEVIAGTPLSSAFATFFKWCSVTFNNLCPVHLTTFSRWLSYSLAQILLTVFLPSLIREPLTNWGPQQPMYKYPTSDVRRLTSDLSILKPFFGHGSIFALQATTDKFARVTRLFRLSPVEQGQKQIYPQITQIAAD